MPRTSRQAADADGHGWPAARTGIVPVSLRAIDVQVGVHGTNWAHYEVAARRSAP